MIHLNKQEKFSCSFLLALFLSFFSALHVNAQNFLHAEGQRIINGKGENVLLRGIGLGGWMLQEGYMLRVNGIGQQQHVIKSKIAELIGEQSTEEFYNQWLSNHTRKIDVDSLKAWGFNSVRLPMHFALYTLPVEKEPVKGKDTWIEKGFTLTDSLLTWCKANKMYLILDLHATPGGQGNDVNISDRDASKPSLWESEENRQKMIRLWKKLAERYVNEEWIGAYDIINEPNWGFEDLANDKNGLKEKKNEPLRQLMIDITKTIREVDKNHIVIIEGNGWGNNYNGILPIWDNNMALSFHKYWNFNDLNSIKHIISFREKNNVPVWLGETGENSNVWFTQAIELFEKNNIGWSWWPLKKIGINNPLEIPSNPNYQQILNYWSGKGVKPSEEDARKGLFKLAEEVKLENNIYHKDVVDAMMRQSHSTETKPFNSNIIANNVVMNAVDYDLGRNGFAYADNDTADYHISVKSTRGIGNRGHAYRNDGVDIQRDADKTFYVSNMEDNEWLQYTLNVKEEGTYTIWLNVASVNDSAQLHIEINGVKINSAVAVPNTGANNKWQNVEVQNVMLEAGTQVFRIYVNKGDCNLKSITFIKGNTKKK
jgi:endoglucanase